MFCAVTGFVPSPTLEEHHQKPGNRLTRAMYTLRKSVLKSSNKQDDELKYTLFSPTLHTEMRENKDTMVKLIKKHDKSMLALRKIRKKCWKSKDKLNKYTLILETQRSALQHNLDQFKHRNSAIKDMEKMNKKWMTIHERNEAEFDKLYRVESKYRHQIRRIAKDIELDVLELLSFALQFFMERHGHYTSVTDIDKLAQQIYTRTSRKYKFYEAQNTPCQKVWIEKPLFEDAGFNEFDLKKIVIH